MLAMMDALPLKAVLKLRSLHHEAHLFVHFVFCLGHVLPGR